jgi:hypothetical protein
VEIMTSVHDDRGLVGKILILWLVVLVVVGVALWDAGSIGVTYLRTANLAQDAARAGAQRFEETGERGQAARAVIAAVAAADDDARLERVKVSRRGEVLLVLTDEAATLIAGRVGFLEDLTTVTSTTRAAPR